MGNMARTKGQTGERETMAILNPIVQKVLDKHNIPRVDEIDLPFQRNQNQTAVGGDDLTNPFGLSIEVKRQEALSVNTWWKQCVTSAARSDGIPILMYRQNRKKWRVRMLADIPIKPKGLHLTHHLTNVCVEMDLESFERWFESYCDTWLRTVGGWPASR